MANLGYILKESVMTASAEMTDKEFRDTIKGLFNYAVKGEEPNFETPLQKAVFFLEKPSIDYNNAKWALKSRVENVVRNINNDSDKRQF